MWSCGSRTRTAVRPCPCARPWSRRGAVPLLERRHQRHGAPSLACLNPLRGATLRARAHCDGREREPRLARQMPANGWFTFETDLVRTSCAHTYAGRWGVRGQPQAGHKGIKVEFIGIIGAPTQGRTRRGNTLTARPSCSCQPCAPLPSDVLHASLPARVPSPPGTSGSSRACQSACGGASERSRQPVPRCIWFVACLRSACGGAR